MLGKFDRGPSPGAILGEGNVFPFFVSLCHISDRVLPALLHMRFRRQKIRLRIGSDRFVEEFEFSTPWGVKISKNMKNWGFWGYPFGAQHNAPKYAFLNAGLVLVGWPIC